MNLHTLRRDALAIFHAGLQAVDAIAAIRRHVSYRDQKLNIDGRTYDLSRRGHVYVVGAGKASAAMAQAIEEIVGEDKLKAGLVSVKYGHAGASLRVIQAREAGHPVPDEAGLNNSKQIIELLRQTTRDDLVICLLSGGGSALLPCPTQGVTLADKQRVTQLLLQCGATIHEINAVRKHLSQLKGGRLARLAAPSRVVSLILSDVVGDDVSSIASGPTAPDDTTFADCLRILDKYQLRDQIPSAVLKVLQRGARGQIEETPKSNDPLFRGQRRPQNLIIGSNILAVEAAKRKAEAAGYRCLVLSTLVEGETREVARVHAAIAKEICRSGNPIPRPACIISGGETTVTIRGRGLGGRNQEFALAAAIDIDGWKNVVILSGGTDGSDGPTDAAGAIADGTTVQRARLKGLDPQRFLRDNDSYHFFRALGDLLITGPTLTNVMDLRLILVG
ncbi:MAG: glycerate kinase [Acidobacteriota bacterium]|nr:glycerate kinase [Blastocatellia bacterium]MDW8239168.1 glycerate kinase [Acidobacteriota bacterium]